MKLWHEVHCYNILHTISLTCHQVLDIPLLFLVLQCHNEAGDTLFFLLRNIDIGKKKVIKQLKCDIYAGHIHSRWWYLPLKGSVGLLSANLSAKCKLLILVAQEN